MPCTAHKALWSYISSSSAGLYWMLYVHNPQACALLGALGLKVYSHQLSLTERCSRGTKCLASPASASSRSSKGDSLSSKAWASCWYPLLIWLHGSCLLSAGEAYM